MLVLLAAAALFVCSCAEQDRRDAIDALFLAYFGQNAAVTQREMDSVYYGLSDELRAATPEEVGTVVRVGCSENVFAHYTDGTEAYQTMCSVLVIDWSLPAIIGQQTFKGDEPAKRQWVQVYVAGGKMGWCRTSELALNVSLSDYAAIQVLPTATPRPPPPAAGKGCPSNPALDLGDRLHCD